MGMKQMANVKRYDLKQDGEYSQTEGVMHEVANGDWVHADDYNALDAECERLRIIIKDATDSAKEALRHLSNI